MGGGVTELETENPRPRFRLDCRRGASNDVGSLPGPLRRGHREVIEGLIPFRKRNRQQEAETSFIAVIGEVYSNDDLPACDRQPSILFGLGILDDSQSTSP